MRREQRVALAAFRHLSHPCVYTGEYSKTVDGFSIRYIEHKAVEVFGEGDLVTETIDTIDVLISELPQSAVGDVITDSETNKRYRLGREVQDDGYIRTLESLRI